MATFVQDFYTSRNNKADGTTQIGDQDRLWYDPITNTIRVWNGLPGGKIVGSGQGGGGRGYATRLVTTNYYTAVADDYYIGVNYAGPVTIYLPTALNAEDGDMLVIKDESGNCAVNNITLVGNVDNDSGGAILAINNGALHMIYRSGWRVM
jgi:hypothetical protein